VEAFLSCLLLFIRSRCLFDGSDDRVRTPLRPDFFLHIDDRVRTQLRPDFFSSHWNVKTRSLDAAGFECEEKNVWTQRGSNPVITAAERGPIPRIPKKKSVDAAGFEQCEGKKSVDAAGFEPGHHWRRKRTHSNLRKKSLDAAGFEQCEEKKCGRSGVRTRSSLPAKGTACLEPGTY
jgi:hypothetical protein